MIYNNVCINNNILHLEAQCIYDDGCDMTMQCPLCLLEWVDHMPIICTKKHPCETNDKFVVHPDAFDVKFYGDYYRVFCPNCEMEWFENERNR